MMTREFLALLGFLGACLYALGLAWLGDLRTRRRTVQRDAAADQRFVEGRRYK